MSPLWSEDDHPSHSPVASQHYLLCCFRIWWWTANRSQLWIKSADCYRDDQPTL